MLNTKIEFPIIKISAYKAWKDKPGCKPYDTDFYTEMNRIRDGYYKEVADKYRSITDKEQQYKYKISDLPSLTISAVCKNWRKLDNVVNHTGLLNLDIDKKSNQHIEDWGELRDSIFKMHGVVSSFISVSGQGVTFVVKIHPDQHKDAFFSIVDGMKNHMGIVVDPGLHDVVRLRFVSDDPGAKIRYNFNEIPFSEPSEQYLQGKKSYGHEQTILEPIGDADSEYNFNEAVKKAESLFTFSDGSKWSFLISVAGSCNIMGMSLKFCQDLVLNRYKSQTNISTDRLLQPINEIYKLYKHQHGAFDIELKAEKLTSRVRNHLIYEWLHEGKTPKTDEDLLSICESYHVNKERLEIIIDRVFGEYSNEFGYNKMPKVRRVEIWLNKRWTFKFNSVTAQPEVSELGSSSLITVNPDEIYRQLSLARFKFPITDVKSLIKSEFVKPYDPILEYFQSLTWDGKDYISQLASYIRTDNDEEFWPKQFRKSLLRSIKCGLGLKENRIVMVLYGQKQETGKSTFIRFLSPWQDKYFTESPIIGGNQKDTEIRFSENFIYNIEELAGLSRIDINKLKADISKVSIKERRSYAAFETSAPRRCNFWASTNQKEFLHDDENTRWVVFDIQSINWSYKQEIDINKVWGQAWHLYKSGESGELDEEDRAIREHLNEQYRYRRPEEDLIIRHFEPCEPKQGKFFSATEIAIELNKLSQSFKINPNHMGKLIKNIWDLDSCQVKINGKNTRGYWMRNGFNDAEGENRGWSPVTGISFNNQ